MRFIHLLFATVVFQLAVTTAGQSSRVGAKPRSKRGTWELGWLILCATGRPGYSYIDYGCYCGITDGNPGDPVDGVDKCCESHDQCYRGTSCEDWTSPYLFFCWWGTVSCWNSEGTCQRQLCECDRQLVDCFADNPYNATLLNFCPGKE
ncbi:basic phospholipase A2 4-like [Branchiostoma lanceolatum]|uniref:basic phospholipase A2 4-like n=1 Tax=Branchiostoma lanceolatum TaxID=7740 RepID=UPI00345560D4